MTLNGTDRGAGGDTTGATTYAMSPDATIPAGVLVVLLLSYDNAGTNGADPYSSIADSVGNTWTARNAGLQDPGAANAGIAFRFFTSLLTTQLLTSNTVTVTFSASTGDKAYQFIQVDASAGVAAYKTGATAPAGAGTGTTSTITTGTITNTNMVIAASAFEWDVTDIPVADGDTTNGTWSGQINSVSGGTTSAAVQCNSQRKIVTATATQTYNVTSNPDVDRVLGWIEIEEIGVASRVIVAPSQAAHRASSW